MADTADQVVGRRLAIFDGHHINRISLIVRPQNQMIACRFHVFHRAGSVFQDGVHVELALAIGLEGIVVTVDQERGAGKETRVHAHTFAAIDLNYDEAFPLLAIGAFSFRFQLLEKCFLELQDFLHVHAGDERLGGGDGSVGEKDVLELVIAGRQDGSALVDLGRVKKIQHGKMLNGQNPVHALKAEAALAIEEVGDVGLLESCLLCQTEAGEVAFLNALPDSIPQVVLQHSEFHSWEYSMGVIALR